MKVIQEVDVLVVGGGTAGFIAAIAAARNGAKTTIVEQTGVLGGTPTAGLMTIFVTLHDADGRQVVKGVGNELIQRITKAGGAMGYTYETQGNMDKAAPIDAEVAKYIMINMAEEAEVDILFDTICTDVLIKDKEVKGIIASNKTGNSIILAKRIIDSTGDGDVSVFAGARYEMRPNDVRQPVTLMFRMGNANIEKWLDYMKRNPEQFNLAEGVKSLDKPWILNILKNFKPWQQAIASGEMGEGFALEQVWYHTHAVDMSKGEMTFNMTRIIGYDSTDAKESSKLHKLLQKQIPIAEKFIQKNMPGFENAYVIDSASILGVRESRRIIGDYILTADDVKSGKKGDDIIGLSACPIDIHESHGDGHFVWDKTDKRGSKSYGIPYGCLIPKNIDNLLVAGRCISATWDANGSVRMQGSCLVTGQAAGTAAALSLKQGVTPRNINLEELRKTEKKQGVVLE
jgi:ribulose 1,5-bisphosphate synthetase/thiazole synthase